MSVEQSVATLLLEHECVIIPGFGGFVCNHAPAHYDKTSRIFHPPSSKISFNQKLNSNDGLLLNALTTKTGKSYDAVKIEVEEWVDKTQNTLKNGVKVLLPKIGTLGKNGSAALEFYPDNSVNFLKSSYGLNNFRLAQIEKPVTKIIDIKEAKTSRNKYGGVWAAAVAILLIGSAYFVTFHGNQIPGMETGYADFGSLFPTGPKTYEYKKFEGLELEATPDLVAILDKSENEFEYVELVPNAGLQPIVVRIKDPAPDVPAIEDNTKVIRSKKKMVYHVIGGCFSVKSNAKKLVRQLKKAGYNAVLLGRHKNLHAVCYESYGTRAEAVRSLENVRDNHNTKAWLLEKEF